MRFTDKPEIPQKQEYS